MVNRFSGRSSSDYLAPLEVPTLEDVHAVIDRHETEAAARAEADTLAEIEARRPFEEAELVELTDRLRRGYMSSPGATEAGFAAALPTILEDVRRQASLAPPPVARSPISRRDIFRPDPTAAPPTRDPNRWVGTTKARTK